MNNHKRSHEKQENSWFTSNWHPVAFSFKDGGGLAEHPLIFHHQRMFGSQENGKENERKGEKKAAAKLPPVSVLPTCRK